MHLVEISSEISSLFKIKVILRLLFSLHVILQQTQVRLPLLNVIFYFSRVGEDGKRRNVDPNI